MNKRNFLSAPHMSGNELKYIEKVFESNYIAPLGEYVNKFEDSIKNYTKSEKALAVTSGTAAIHLALRVLGITKDDDVLASTFTFIGSVNAILYQGANPVFIDSDDETWNLSAKLLNKYLCECEKKPKALIVTHLYGMCADIEKIADICRLHGVYLIEDAAESLGAIFKGKHTGTFGEFGVFSFNGNKIITTSGGGMLVSDDEEKIKKVRFWSTQSRDVARHYQHSELGFNYRMSNVVAGIGRGQLKVLDQRVAKKKYIFEFYKRELGQLEGVEFMPINDWNDPNYWLSVMTLKGTVRPLDVMEALEKENIESRPVWKPMHMQPFFAEYDYVGGDVSEKLFEYGVCLPSDTKMTDEDLERICGIIKSLWK